MERWIAAVLATVVGGLLTFWLTEGLRTSDRDSAPPSFSASSPNKQATTSEPISSSSVAAMQADPPPGANVAQFLGTWENENGHNGGTTRLAISQRLDRINIHQWGSCEPTDCDNGDVQTAVADSDDGTLDIEWTYANAIVISQRLTVLSDGRLQLATHTHFIDNSGRPDFDSVDYLRR
jgi:hypothetical protein